MKNLNDLICKNQKPNITIAEIGVYNGHHLNSYAEIIRANKGKIYAFDWFKGQFHAKDKEQEIFFDQDSSKIIEEFKKNCAHNLDIIEIIEGKTSDTFSRIKDESLDICYIDASHSYEDVKNDIINFMPKIKKGGIICGDDLEDISLRNSFSKEQLDLDCTYHLGRPIHAGVIQAVYEIFGDDIISFGTNQWMKKI
jgi:hypothetical protein